MEEFRIRLAEAMKLRSIKASELSRRTDISKATISRYLNGEFKAKQNNIYFLANALDVNEAWLMGYDVKMDRNLTPINKPLVINFDDKLSDAEFEYFSNWNPKEQPTDDILVSENEADLIKKYRELDVDKQRMISDLLNEFHKNMFNKQKRRIDMAWTVKSTAEKEAEAREKMYGVFGSSELSNQEDAEAVKRILTDLQFSVPMQEGMTIALGSIRTENAIPIYYQKELLAQNFIIIRQLDRISKQLEELNKK